MVLTIATEPPPLRSETNGTVYIGDTRVPLHTVIYAYLNGSTAEEIADDYDTLDLSEVYSVLGYYLRHREEVHDYLQERRRYADEVQAGIEAWQQGLGFDRAGLRKRLLARLASKSEG
jgi:uncharacterized protein (DUF433 family)